MKKLLAFTLSLLMLLSSSGALGSVITMEDQDPDANGFDPGLRRISAEDFRDFVVGATTRLSGDFFTDMWGNNTCDIDVRSLIHGYNTVYWDTQSAFAPNLTVLAKLDARVLEGGDKRYTIQIQEDLSYSDGTPITARDYVFSLMLHAAPQVAAIGGATTKAGHIVGFEAYNSGEVEYFAGLRLIDEYTFTLDIKAECLPFFFELGLIAAIPYPISAIAPGCVVEDDGRGAVIRNRDPGVSEPIFTAELLEKTVLDPETGYLSHPSVSSGPYALVDFDGETRVARFKINPYFKGDWNGQRPSIDNVVFKPVRPSEMMDQIESGEVHLLNKVVSGTDIARGQNMDGVRSASYPRLGFGFISFSCEQGPFQFEAVRKAVAYSLDVPQFCAEYNANYGVAVYGYYGVGQWMFQLVANAAQIELGADDPDAAPWSTLTLDRLNTYDVNAAAAEQMLIGDGWTLNPEGGEFRKGVDEYRCKRVDGELMPLIVKWGKTKDSVAADILQEMLSEPLGALGIRLEITEVPFEELLEHYYRQRDRAYDMMYLATNFTSVFDPYFVFNTRDEYQGHQNTTGYRDAALEALALNLRRTEPGELFEYCQKWIAFQTYFNDKLPMLPLYGNIYFDFFTPYLRDYAPGGSEMENWPTALLYAYLAEPADGG